MMQTRLVLCLVLLSLLVLHVHSKITNIYFSSKKMPLEPLVGGVKIVYVDNFAYDYQGQANMGKLSWKITQYPIGWTKDKKLNLNMALYSDEGFSWPSLQRALDENPFMNCTDRANPKYTKLYESLDNKPEFDVNILQSAQPHFWFLLVEGCNHEDTDANSLAGLQIEVHWQNPGSYFRAEYSYDEQTIMETHLVGLLFYSIFALVVIGAGIAMIIKKAFHWIVRLFMISFFTLFTSLAFVWLHYTIYGADGIGVFEFKEFGLVLQLISELLFILVLFLFANGWTISQLFIRSKNILFGFMITLSVAYSCLYIWSNILVSRFTTDYIFMEVPGIIIALLRLPCIVFFLYLAISSIVKERNVKKKIYYGVFSGIFTLWFLILPVIIMVAYAVSPTWRAKVIQNVVMFVNLIAYVILFVFVACGAFLGFYEFTQDTRNLVMRANTGEIGTVDEAQSLTSSAPAAISTSE